MTDELARLLGGALAAVLVAAIARRRRSLSRSGAAAAVAVGTAVVAAGGWWWGAILVLFFVTSSALSRLGASRRTGAEETVRGAERDAVQVLVNGAVAATAALVAALAPQDAWPALFGAFAGALAAATADTWATEIGRLSRTAPRLIVGWRPVAPGTSGGVTALGCAASAAGALLIAAAAGLGVAAGWAPGTAAVVSIAVAAAGLAGSAADSLLGATLQAAYRCPACGAPTERRLHRCGTATVLVRGHPVATNDVVNAAAAAVGAAVAAAVIRFDP